jgi:hypothetical protein
MGSIANSVARIATKSTAEVATATSDIRTLVAVATFWVMPLRISLLLRATCTRYG